MSPYQKPEITQEPLEKPEMFTHELERRLALCGCKVDLMQPGRLPHREINGKEYTPPEFMVTHEFEVRTSTAHVITNIEKQIMRYVDAARRRQAFAGTTYVTLRDAMRFPTQAHVSISVLVV